MIVAMSETASAAETIPLRLVSFNVRYETKHPAKHEKPWKIRGPRLCAQLDFITQGHDSAFLCLQEVLDHQLGDIQSRLGHKWKHVGVGRDDGNRKGEFSPIFYRPDTWQLEHFQTYWLSETPYKPSRGWDAAFPRLVTVGDFVHRRTGTKAVVMSTHFDHRGKKAREESAKMILNMVAEASQGAGGKPPAAVLLGGDFNSEPSDGAYRTMVARGSGMTDVAAKVPEDRRYGNEITYTSFDEPNEPPLRIDFLFLREPSAVKVKSFAVLANKFDDGVFISDHRPVVSDLEVPVARGGNTAVASDGS